MSPVWSYILSAIGLAGFFLAGKKVWWAWYVNIANQFVWATYSFVTSQWGFLIGTFFYTAVFVKNAYRWTCEHYDVEYVGGKHVKRPTEINVEAYCYGNPPHEHCPFQDVTPHPSHTVGYVIKT